MGVEVLLMCSPMGKVMAPCVCQGHAANVGATERGPGAWYCAALCLPLHCIVAPSKVDLANPKAVLV